MVMMEMCDVCDSNYEYHKILIESILPPARSAPVGRERRHDGSVILAHCQGIVIPATCGSFGIRHFLTHGHASQQLRHIPSFHTASELCGFDFFLILFELPHLLLVGHPAVCIQR